MNILLAEQRGIAFAGSMIELVAAFVISYHVLLALLAVIRRRGSDEARLRIAEGVLSALGFSLAGTLLKTIGLESWAEIRLFAFIFMLRTLLKRVFQWEEQRIRRRMRSPITPADA